MKLVFHSSTIAMMHGPINIRYINALFEQNMEFIVIISGGI